MLGKKIEEVSDRIERIVYRVFDVNNTITDLFSFTIKVRSMTQ